MRSGNYLPLYFSLFVQRIFPEKGQGKSSGEQCVSETSKPIQKRFIQLSLLAFFMLVQPAITRACELKFSISGEKKEVYKIGEELIVEVTVVYTHRTCEIQLSDTKFTYEGMKILGATTWKEKAPNTFARQIKLSLLDDSLDQASLTITRKCSKEGAIGTFRISKTK